MKTEDLLRKYSIYLVLDCAPALIKEGGNEEGQIWLLSHKCLWVSDWLTGGFGASGEVSALNSDAEQSMGAGAVLVHLSAERDPVSSSCG